jgi:transposase
MKGLKGYTINRDEEDGRFFPPEDRIQIVSIACQNPEVWGLAGQTRWTIQTLQYILERENIIKTISATSVHRILFSMDYKPHLMNYYLFCEDPELHRKAKRICSLYLNPPEDRIVLSFDERSGTQALERKHYLPCRKGVTAKVDFNYVRHGTIDLFAVFDIRTGEVFGDYYLRHTQNEFMNFMDKVVKRYKGQKLTIILDNLRTHTTPAVKKWLKEHNGMVKFVFTPKHASWLNQIELWFRELNQKCLKRLSVRSTDELKGAMKAWIKTYNRHYAHPYNWKSNGILKRNPKAA